MEAGIFLRNAFWAAECQRRMTFLPLLPPAPLKTSSTTYELSELGKWLHSSECVSLLVI